MVDFYLLWLKGFSSNMASNIKWIIYFVFPKKLSENGGFLMILGGIDVN